MNITYLLPPLIAFILGLVLSFIVIRSNYRSATHRIFAGFLLSIALWGFVIFGMRASPDLQHALPWDRAVTPLAAASAVLYFHFTVRYTNIRLPWWLMWLAYLSLLLVCALGPTSLLVPAVQLKPYGYAPVAGPFFFPVILLQYVWASLAGVNLIRGYKNSTMYEERNRLTYLLVALLLFFLLSTFDLLPLFGLPLYPGAIIGNVLFSSLTAFAILKYNLLDIRIVVRKGTAYVLMSAVVAIFYAGIILAFTQLFKGQVSALWLYLGLVIALAFVLQPLWQQVQRIVDRWFYRDTYNYLKALEAFSRQSQSLRDPASLIPHMLNLFTGALRTSSICLLLPSADDDNFAVAGSIGLGTPPLPFVLKRQNPLVKWLERYDNMLSERDFDIIPLLQSLTPEEREQLQKVHAELIVPLRTRLGYLSGILILGAKLSQQPYTIEDKQLIRTLCAHMATTLDNMRLYKESIHSEERLRESAASYRALADSITDVFFAMDSDLRYIYWNRASEELTGISAGDALGKHLLDLFPDSESTRRAEKVYRKALKTKLPQYFVNEYELKGRTLSLEINVYPSEDGISVVARNITERKEAEERERQLQQELYESGRLAAIGELAAGVAHEINNPLTAILGFSQRVLKKSHDKSLTQDLERISGEALRAARIVQNLLTFARRREPEKEDCDANDILQRALELRAYELRTSNIKVVTDLSPHLPKVRADSHQIQEIFLNIILNAEQAMVEAHQRGTLSIKTCQNKNYVQIVFSDDGPGIAKENLSRIFHPFFSTRADKGGTGLGLSICHGIVTEHGGKIQTKSRLGEGATFIVELPVAAGETSKHKTAEKKPAKKADRYHRPISSS